MKYISLMIAAAMSLAAIAMDNTEPDINKDNWHTVPVFDRKLVFELFVARLGGIYNWDTIDDQTAVKLRALNWPWHTKIIAHRAQKIALLAQWMHSKCPAAKEWMTQALSIKNLDNITCIPRNKFGCGFRLMTVIKAHVTSNLIEDPRLVFVEPLSTVIGPSGNRLYGSVIYEKPDGNTINYYNGSQQACCTINADGSVDVVDIINSSNAILDTYHNMKMFTAYAHDTDQTRFCCIAVAHSKDQAISPYIVVGGSGSLHAYPASCFETRRTTWDQKFIDSTISTSVWDYGDLQLKDDAPYPSVYIEDRFTEGGKRCDHYKHMVDTSDGKSPLSYAHLNHLNDLQQYIKSCPQTESKTATKDPLFSIPLRTVTHTFVPSEEWPLELFQRIVGMMRIVTAPSNMQHFYHLSESWAVNTVSKYVQAVVLAGGCAESYCDVLLKRCRVACNSTSCLLSDALGRRYYKNSKGNFKYLHTNDDKYGVLFHDWASRIAATNVTPEASLDYLKTHRKDALTVSPSEFIKFFVRRAKCHAQKTWDNGTIGAYWSFDDAGMRVQLFDLKAENNNLIRTDLIPNRSTGTITGVDYVHGQQPTFYVDGKLLQ